MLLFWPIYGIAFYTLERGLPGRVYFPVESVIDAYIPFCEWFFIPYLFWFVLIVAMHGYTLFFDIPAFKKMMKFFMMLPLKRNMKHM